MAEDHVWHSCLHDPQVSIFTAHWGKQQQQAHLVLFGSVQIFGFMSSWHSTCGMLHGSSAAILLNTNSIFCHWELMAPFTVATAETPASQLGWSGWRTTAVVFFKHEIHFSTPECPVGAPVHASSVREVLRGPLAWLQCSLAAVFYPQISVTVRGACWLWCVRHLHDLEMYLAHWGSQQMLAEWTARCGERTWITCFARQLWWSMMGQAGARSFFWAAHMDGRGPGTWAIFPCSFSGH